MRADCPSGKFPANLVLLRISRLSFSVALFVLIRIQCFLENDIELGNSLKSASKILAAISVATLDEERLK